MRPRRAARGLAANRAAETGTGGAGHGAASWPLRQLTEIVAPVVAKAGYDLEDLGISRVGRRHLLRLVVDTDGGVNLDAVAELSRQVSEALDAAESGGEELIVGED